MIVLLCILLTSLTQKSAHFSFSTLMQCCKQEAYLLVQYILVHTNI